MKRLIYLSLIIFTIRSNASDSIKWNVIYQDASGIKKKTISPHLITKVADDVYCLEKTYESGDVESVFYKELKGEVVDCVYLKQNFQLYSFCDLKRGLTYTKQGLDTKGFDIYLECSTEK